MSYLVSKPCNHSKCFPICIAYLCLRTLYALIRFTYKFTKPFKHLFLSALDCSMPHFESWHILMVGDGRLWISLHFLHSVKLLSGPVKMLMELNVFFCFVSRFATLCFAAWAIKIKAFCVILHVCLCPGRQEVTVITVGYYKWLSWPLLQWILWPDYGFWIRKFYSYCLVGSMRQFVLGDEFI